MNSAIIRETKELAIRVAEECKALRTLINNDKLNLADLNTTTEANLVAAINEVLAATGGGGGGGDLSQTDIDTIAKLNAILTDATLIDTADARLSDARTPTAHTHTLSQITDAGTAAAAATGDFATAAQGTTADSALQPGGALGTPSSGTLTNCTFPTLNQSTTGNAATATALETGRTINGVTFDGSQSITVGCLAVDVTGTLSLAQGGTSAGTASGARTNLGLGATDAVTHGSLTTTGDITLGGVGSDYISVNILGNVEPRFYLKTGTNGAKAKVAYQINNSTFSFTNYGGGAFKFFNSASSVLTISNTGDLTASGTVKTGGYTVATLPTPVTGMRAYVTDSNRAAANNFGSTVIAAGGGTQYTVPVFYDGTDWIIA